MGPQVFGTASSGKAQAFNLRSKCAGWRRPTRCLRSFALWLLLVAPLSAHADALDDLVEKLIAERHLAGLSLAANGDIPAAATR